MEVGQHMVFEDHGRVWAALHSPRDYNSKAASCIPAFVFTQLDFAHWHPDTYLVNPTDSAKPLLVTLVTFPYYVIDHLPGPLFTDILRDFFLFQCIDVTVFY